MTWLILFGLPTLVAVLLGVAVNETSDPGGVWGSALPTVITGIAAWLIAFVVVGIVLLIRAGIRTAF